ncbi:MAG: HAMP domain-containing histidine kinase [Lewinellaceae bacterium]|nr:HAMP domain-containing histidine kinase [Lewinellaceae bacterium]
MLTDRSFHLARTLMAASMLLLGCSLAWFLHRTYREEETALSREVGFVFINTIRNIEGGLLDKLVFRRGHPPGVTEFPPMSKVFRSDSMKVMTFVSREGHALQTRDEKFEIRVNHTSTSERPINELQGSVSMFIALDTDSLWVDSTQVTADTVAFLQRLTKDFSSALAAAGIPVQHRISRMRAGEKTPPKQLMSGLYTDLANGERYGAELSRYELFLFKKMLPQILFALLLFGCMALAFFFVFRTLRTQRRLTALKTEFIQNISHELKTPIATMRVALEALRDFDALKNPGQTKEYLDISQLELQRLSLLVEKVLGIAHLERPGTTLATVHFDFRELTNEVLAALRPRFEQAGAHIELDISGADFQIKGDRLHLSGVLFNLLDNALKYGGEKPEIQVRLHATDEKITLRVQDNGPGIPEAFRSRIFETFFRIPSEAGHQVKGHGLGLSYAAKVVEQHGGKITLGDQPEQGAAFTVELNVF